MGPPGQKEARISDMRAKSSRWGDDAFHRFYTTALTNANAVTRERARMAAICLASEELNEWLNQEANLCH